MNTVEFAHTVGLALGHAGAEMLEVNHQVLFADMLREDNLLAYAGLTSLLVQVYNVDQPAGLSASAGFAPAIVREDGEPDIIGYVHRTLSGRLTISIVPGLQIGLRFEAGSETRWPDGDHVLTIWIDLASNDYTWVEVGDWSLIGEGDVEGREDRLSLLQDIDEATGGQIRELLSRRPVDPEDAAYSDALLCILDQLAIERAEYEAADAETVAF